MRIEPFRSVAPNTCRQDFALPSPRRQVEALQLFDHLRDARSAFSLRTLRNVLPGEEETHQVLGGYGLDRSPQARLGVAVDPRQKSTCAELLRPFANIAGLEPAAQHEAFGLERCEADLDQARTDT